ncbi:EAL domain-containing protein [Vibrio genomosp. F6]|nr:EAL domain-containing protein [Vibrio genomosp. F6]
MWSYLESVQLVAQGIGFIVVNAIREMNQTTCYKQIISNSRLSEVLRYDSELFFSILHNSSNAILITNNQVEIVYVNKQFETISGYKLCEIIGKNPRFLKSKFTPEETHYSLKKALVDRQVWEGEFINIHKSGTEYFEHAVISPIKSTDQHLLGFFAEKRDITELKSEQARSHKIGYLDSLTHLSNRRYFIKAVERLFTIPKEDRPDFSILFIDLNRFKEINDGYGHEVGDQILIEAAKRFNQQCNLNDILARVGGDEFVCLHIHTDSFSAKTLARHLTASLVPDFKVAGSELNISASIGFSSWPNDGNSMKELLIAADFAMYESKNSNRNIFQFNQKLKNKLEREYLLAKKITKADFFLVYQPKVNLKTMQVAGAEALLRWDDPDLGTISPYEFIPIAESRGMIRKIGFWVLRETCTQLNRWKNEGFDFPGRVSINLSIHQVEHEECYQDIMDIINETNAPIRKIEFEVTESAMMQHPDKVKKVINKLSHEGFKFSIDDFGTGFSSLSYLTTLDAHILKIDKSFIDGMNQNRNSRTVVKSIINLSHSLDIKVLAEGVESRDQLKTLLLLGCDMIQGYYFSQPVLPVQLQQVVSSINHQIPD